MFSKVSQKIHQIAILFRTARHLKLRQIAGRVRFRLFRPVVLDLESPMVRGVVRGWVSPARRRCSMLGFSDFRFLNQSGLLSELGWDGCERSKLWRYNQHYFDDLNAVSAEQRFSWHEALIDDWIRSNPVGVGTGWEPYPTSLRIVNWIKWALAGRNLSEQVISSLATQARFLVQRLEWHLLGNHLFANGKALVFVGLFFKGTEAEAWLGKGLEILERELPEQILLDGAQFELSPMYHALAVEDVLDLVNIAHTYGRLDLADMVRDQLPTMLFWLETMSHPDGEIAFFNDTAFGVAPSNDELVEYASRLGFINERRVASVHHLEQSGYVRMSAGQFTLIADFGRIGPDYLPGHAHADTLSFELSIGRQRVFVNSGTSEYGTGPERQRQRGTTAHNAVVIAGENSSEVWAGFRVGRRARPRHVKVAKCNGILRARASHDGYRYLSGRPIVTRCIELDQGGLVISDSITTTASAEARYHLHPSICVSSLSISGAVLELPNGKCFRIFCEGGPLRTESTTWHPEFGISQPNCCLVLPLVDGRAVLRVESA